jgi:predicted DNA-binding transcriptional regulator AlpA
MNLMEKDVPTSVQDDVVMNSAEAAKFIGLSVWWLAKARGKGSGPKFIKIGRAVRYSKASLMDFIKSHTRD